MKKYYGLAIPPSEYDEEFAVASVNTFINNLEVIDNHILNEIANQNMAPCQLIKKRADYKRTTINNSKINLNPYSFKNSASGQLQKQKLDPFFSNLSPNRSALTQEKTTRKNYQFLSKNQKKSSNSYTNERL